MRERGGRERGREKGREGEGEGKGGEGEEEEGVGRGEGRACMWREEKLVLCEGRREKDINGEEHILMHVWLKGSTVSLP